MKKIIYLLIFGFLFLVPSISYAYVIKSDDFIYIAKDEIVEGNLYFTGKSINVEGQILGDLIGFASNIQISGQIKGDLISISQNLIINGQIDGDLRSISSSSNINGVVGKNINFLGENIILGKNSFVGQDLLVKTVNIESSGKIEGSIHGGAYNVLINGEVGKNINLLLDEIKRKKYVSSLEFGETAVVSGNLDYKSGKAAVFKGQNIKGEINHKEPEKQTNKSGKGAKTVYLILSSFLLALLLNHFFKNKLEKFKKIISEKRYKLLLPGSIILLLGPITFIIVAITIIGFPIALIGLFSWCLAIFLSRILVAMFVGDYIFKFLKKERVSAPLKILSGLTFVFLLFALPFIGWAFSLISIITGLGAFYFMIKKQ